MPGQRLPPVLRPPACLGAGAIQLEKAKYSDDHLSPAFQKIIGFALEITSQKDQRLLAILIHLETGQFDDFCFIYCQEDHLLYRDSLFQRKTRICMRE
jgi:hypothetical protein